VRAAGNWQSEAGWKGPKAGPNWKLGLTLLLFTPVAVAPAAGHRDVSLTPGEYARSRLGYYSLAKPKGKGGVEVNSSILRRSFWSRPSRWWRFGTAAEKMNASAPVEMLFAVGAAAGSDRRHGGLCCGRSAAIKPCAFGAPLRGCGA